jgi:hypothetical protein
LEEQQQLLLLLLQCVDFDAAELIVLCSDSEGGPHHIIAMQHESSFAWCLWAAFKKAARVPQTSRPGRSSVQHAFKTPQLDSSQDCRRNHRHLRSPASSLLLAKTMALVLVQNNELQGGISRRDERIAALEQQVERLAEAVSGESWGD